MTTLITPGELADLLKSDQPPTVLDVRMGGPNGGRTLFELGGHIPGSQWIAMDGELSDHDLPGGFRPLPKPADFQEMLRRHGVRNDRPVVALDSSNSMGAARLWWMLRDGGKTDVQVLDGGFAAWSKAGLPVETGPAAAAEPGDVEVTPGQLPQVHVDEVAELSQRILAGEDVPTLWDARPADRFSGQDQSTDAPTGHIPGAKNLPAGKDQEIDGHLRSLKELLDNFKDVKPGDVVYCTTGVEAARTLLAMAVAGLEDVGLYVGSWTDWSADPSRPIEREV